MTFFELIRSSLLADSAEKRPPGELIQAVLCAWREKAVQSPHNPNDSTGKSPLKKPD